MRQILFKAKAENIDGTKDWVVGYLSKCDNKFIICDDDGIGIFVDPDTICQYTGLTDKNGNKIWENDILFAKEPYIPTCPFSIKYNQETISYVGLYDGFGKEFELSKELLSCSEVIGNIFDNADLLKGESHEVPTMRKETMIFDRLCKFMNEHDVDCVEDVFQRDSVNEECVDLVGELVKIMLEE